MYQNNQPPEIIIYPSFNAFRYSFHVHALRALFGDQRIRYSAKEFPSLSSHSLPIIVRWPAGDIKIYISAGDGPGYDLTALEWCDIYAKRTLMDDQMPEQFSSRIIPMGPHFGIRSWGIFNTLRMAVQNYLAQEHHQMKFKDHLWYYLKQYLYRLPEKEFVPGQSRSDFVFYASTLYPSHPGYNQFRVAFIEACRANDRLHFEGGLIRTDNYRVPEYEHITITKYYPVAEWIQKEKESALGFWAPGDQGAMTLKMGEFLALGKAIIAVPIRQEQLPSPLVHGEHVHFVDGSLEGMKVAVQLLITNHEYRQKLERNARKYYEEWVAPAQAVRRFIHEACQRVGVTCEGI